MSTPQGQAGVGRGRFLVARQVTTITDKIACIVTTMVIKTTIVMKMIRRTLPAGSLILDESPLVVAPKTSVTLTCVNCCSRCDRHHKFQIMVTIIMSNMQDWDPLPSLCWMWFPPLCHMSTIHCLNI